VTDDPQVAAARVEVERRRSRLMATAHQLQDRLSPKSLARNTWQGAKEKGADLAEDAVDGVRAHTRSRRPAWSPRSPCSLPASR
jgi:hypothetical protein